MLIAIDPPEAIGDVDGVVLASGTLNVPQAAWAAPGAMANTANSSIQARGEPHNDERRARARCTGERLDMTPDSLFHVSRGNAG